MAHRLYLLGVGLWLVGLAMLPVAVAAQSDRKISVELQPFAEGLDQPTFVTHAGDGSGQLHATERSGRIRLIEQDGSVRPEPILDISDSVQTEVYEQGLLSLAFHPEFATNGRYFISYTREADGAIVVSELAAGEIGGIPGQERFWLVVAQRGGVHNGGHITFDNDGSLLVGLGDGGFSGYEQGQSQDPAVLLGKIVRLNVDDPIARDDAKPLDVGAVEVVASGLRNPWRFSIDRARGDIYIGDVGRRLWEEINVVPEGSAELDFGWSQVEGLECTEVHPNCDIDAFEPPAFAYRTEAGNAIVGGYAYRGTLPGLADAYVFGDLLGRIWAAPADDLVAGIADPMQIALHDKPGMLWSFGEDEDGELLVVSGDGRILRLVGN